MDNISVRAHFDGDRVLLDEPIDLQPGARLIVTVLPEDEGERSSWLRLSAKRLAAAYADDEPDYPAGCIREPNPNYARG